MTREEAIRIAQGLITDFKCESETMVEFCNLIIRVLKQEPCDDAISREDALMALTGDITDCTIEEYIARLREKLSKLPSVGKDINVTTNEDCISRQAVNDGFKKYDRGSFAYGCVWDYVNKLPSVTPKEKIGKWIDIIVGDMPAQACDQCNTFYPLSYTGGGHRYCPNCGVRMIEPQKSEDCRDCKKWEDCPCGKEGHESGTSQGYSIGGCKDFEPQESEVNNG